jgi:hypothetical protein
MHKSAISTVFGLMLIIIIIESTSLSSSLQSNSSISMNPSPVQFSPIVTSTLPVPQIPLQSEQVKAVPVATSPPVVTPTPLSQPAAPQSDLQLSAATPVNGNYMTGVWENSAAIPGTAGIQKAQTPAVNQINSMPTMVTGVGYVEYDEPLPDGDNNISDFWRAVVVPEPTLIPVDYVEIFHQNQLYVYNTTAVSFYLRNPPMKIAFNVTPQISADLKWIPNRDIRKTGIDGKIINVTRPDQNSWLKVTVFDKEGNGTIIQREGYGGIYDHDPSKEITIREPGYYQVLIEGGYIIVNTSIRVPRQGNVR